MGPFNLIFDVCGLEVVTMHWKGAGQVHDIVRITARANAMANALKWDLYKLETKAEMYRKLCKLR